MGAMGKCGETVRQAVMYTVGQPCISPPLGGEVKNFFNKKKIKKYQKKCTFPLDKAVFCPIFIVEMGGSTEFPKGEKNGYRLQNFQPRC
jgi:hypothetical protein